MSITEEVKSKLPVDDVCYMIRCLVVEDYSRIEKEEYLSQMTKGYRQIVDHLLLKGRNKAATHAYVHYFLCIKGNLKIVRDRVWLWAQEFEWEDKNCAISLAGDMLRYLDTEKF